MLNNVNLPVIYRIYKHQLEPTIDLGIHMLLNLSGMQVIRESTSSGQLALFRLMAKKLKKGRPVICVRHQV